MAQRQVSRWKVSRLKRANECQIVPRSRMHGKHRGLTPIGRRYIDFHEETGEPNYPQKRVNLLCRAPAFSTIKSTSERGASEFPPRVRACSSIKLYEQNFTERGKRSELLNSLVKSTFFFLSPLIVSTLIATVFQRLSANQLTTSFRSALHLFSSTGIRLF